MKAETKGALDLSIVVPVYNSAPHIGEVANRILSFLENGNWSGELIFVDDGSGDESWQAIVAKASTDSRIHGIRLERNYGQHTALMCGLRASAGDWVVTLDDDLENPPEEIELLLRAGKEGSDLVFGRFERPRHGFTRRLGSTLINAINRVAFRKPVGIGVSNFRLIRRDVVEGYEAVLVAVSNGSITPDEGSTIASVLEAKRKSIETCDLESRLAALENSK